MAQPCIAPKVPVESKPSPLVKCEPTNEPTPPAAAAPAGACRECGKPIRDKEYVSTGNDSWHSGCLCCSECGVNVSGEDTCYERGDRIYCKKDYHKIFNQRSCHRCGQIIPSTEMVQRARSLVFHLTCFTCSICQKTLETGDRIGLQNNEIFCISHSSCENGGGYPMTSCANGNIPMNTCINQPIPNEYDSLPPPPPLRQPMMMPPPPLQVSQCGTMYLPHMYQPTQVEFLKSLAASSTAQAPKGRPKKKKALEEQMISYSNQAAAAAAMCDPDGSMQALFTLNDPHRNPHLMGDMRGAGGHGGGGRSKRMRTSFKHHQLQAMKVYFNANHNPDAKDLKQLATKTGLTKRVLQVWFQNARAKFRRNLMREQLQASRKEKSSSECAANGGGGGEPNGAEEKAETNEDELLDESSEDESMMSYSPASSTESHELDTSLEEN